MVRKLLLLPIDFDEKHSTPLVDTIRGAPETTDAQKAALVESVAAKSYGIVGKSIEFVPGTHWISTKTVVCTAAAAAVGAVAKNSAPLWGLRL